MLTHEQLTQYIGDNIKMLTRDVLRYEQDETMTPALAFVIFHVNSIRPPETIGARNMVKTLALEEFSK